MASQTAWNFWLAPSPRSPHPTPNRQRQELLSRSARLAYPVRDGIPAPLENEARTLSDDELRACCKHQPDRPLPAFHHR